MSNNLPLVMLAAAQLSLLNEEDATLDLDGCPVKSSLHIPVAQHALMHVRKVNLVDSIKNSQKQEIKERLRQVEKTSKAIQRMNLSLK